MLQKLKLKDIRNIKFKKNLIEGRTERNQEIKYKKLRNQTEVAIS